MIIFLFLFFFNGREESLKFQSVLNTLPGLDDFCYVETSEPAFFGGAGVLGAATASLAWFQDC